MSEQQNNFITREFQTWRVIPRKDDEVLTDEESTHDTLTKIHNNSVSDIFDYFEKEKNNTGLKDINGKPIYEWRHELEIELHYNNGRVGKDKVRVKYDDDYMQYLFFSTNDESIYTYKEISNPKIVGWSASKR